MKRLSANPKKVNAQVIGLDVHKTWTVYCILDRGGRELETGRVRSRRSDLIELFKSKIGRKRSHVAFEASRCSLWVFEVAAELYGRERVHVAQAHKVRAIANSKDKTDLNDAWWLAYLTQEGRLPEAYVPPKTILELRVLTRERLSFVRRRTAVITRLKSHLAQMGEVVPGSAITSEKAQLFVAEMALRTPGARGRALRSCLHELDFVDAMIDEWTAAVAELADQLEAVTVLSREIPGVGPTLAATIVAEAGEIDRFHSAKAFARYSGLTPAGAPVDVLRRARTGVAADVEGGTLTSNTTTGLQVSFQ